MQEVKGCPVSEARMATITTPPEFTNGPLQWVVFCHIIWFIYDLMTRTPSNKVPKGNETRFRSVWRHGRNFVMSYRRSPHEWTPPNSVKALNRDVSQWQSASSQVTPHKQGRTANNHIICGIFRLIWTRWGDSLRATLAHEMVILILNI